MFFGNLDYNQTHNKKEGGFKMESKTIITPSLLEGNFLAPVGLDIFKKAIGCGKISTHELSSMLSSNVVKDKQLLASAISSVKGSLLQTGVVIVTGIEDVESRLNQPRIRRVRIMNRQKDDFYKSERDIPYLSRSDLKHHLSLGEQIALAKDVKENKSLVARDKLVEIHMRLVPFVAKSYLGRGLDWDDLIQEGNLGLLMASERFDYTLGNTFSTFAVSYIRGYILIALRDKSATIRLPGNLQNESTKVFQAYQDLKASSFIGLITAEEVANHLGMSPLTVQKIIDYYNLKPVYLDAEIEVGSINGDGGFDGHRLTPDANSFRADHIVEAKEELEISLNKIRQLSKTLPTLVFSRESLKEDYIDIFKSRYGLNGIFLLRSLRMIGNRFGYSHQRINQIVETIWAKLDDVDFPMNDYNLKKELRRIHYLENILGVEAGLLL